MQGHIRKRVHTAKNVKKTVRWDVVVDVGRSPDGKRPQRWHGGFGTRSDAERARAHLVGSVYAGTSTEPSQMTFSDWVIDHWMAIVGARARPSTIASYRANLDHYGMPALGGVRLQAIGPERLDALDAHLLISGRVDGMGGLAHRSVGNIHLLMRLVLAGAQVAGLLRHNQLTELTPKRTKAKRKPIRAWDVDSSPTSFATSEETIWKWPDVSPL